MIFGIPIVMNTSFNGPKEPVIESVKGAIDFLNNTNDITAVLFGGEFLLTKTLN